MIINYNNMQRFNLTTPLFFSECKKKDIIIQWYEYDNRNNIIIWLGSYKYTISPNTIQEHNWYLKTLPSFLYLSFFFAESIVNGAYDPFWPRIMTTKNSNELTNNIKGKYKLYNKQTWYHNIKQVSWLLWLNLYSGRDTSDSCSK